MDELTQVSDTVNLRCDETDEDSYSSNMHSAPAKSAEPKQWPSRVRVIIKDHPKLSVLLLVVITNIVTAVVCSVVLDTDCSKSNKSEDKDIWPEAKPLLIVFRNEWLSQPPRETLTSLKLPVHQVIIVHTATEACNTQAQCVNRVRCIQEQHISRNNYSDIGYNFLIGGDGQVYEGRGWLKVGSFLRGQNSKSIGIAFIGDYRRIEATKDQLGALNSLLVNGTNSGCLSSDFKLYGAQQFQLTESPGKMLYEQLKKHNHWSERPQS